MKTMQQLCRDAILVQDACNLSGVVHSFSAAMTDLRAHLSTQPDFSTDKLNRHPVAQMYASKIASLTGCEDARSFTNAYSECDDIANGTTSATATQ
jgi:hypothetical protein